MNPSLWWVWLGVVALFTLGGVSGGNPPDVTLEAEYSDEKVGREPPQWTHCIREHPTVMYSFNREVPYSGRIAWSDDMAEEAQAFHDCLDQPGTWSIHAQGYDDGRGTYRVFTFEDCTFIKCWRGGEDRPSAAYTEKRGNQMVEALQVKITPTRSTAWVHVPSQDAEACWEEQPLAASSTWPAYMDANAEPGKWERVPRVYENDEALFLRCVAEGRDMGAMIGGFTMDWYGQRVLYDRDLCLHESCEDRVNA